MKQDKTLIIAEAGVNHNGKIDLALELINAASDCGADIIKFQTFKAEDLILKTTPKTKYQIKNTKSSESQFKMLKALEMSDMMHEKIVNHCLKKNIEFLSSAFDINSLKYLVNLGIKRIKIPSGEITNLPYLEKAASFRLPLIVSTGMSNLTEINNTYKFLKSCGIKNDMITFLHCTSEYPAELTSINLNAIKTISDYFKVSVGYSDHTIKKETSIAAVALGASVVEKHITLNKFLEGPDHKASSDPVEFKKMVNSIRIVEKILGDTKKKVHHTEIANAKLVRKSIVASKFIKKGDLFTHQNLTTKRPGTGLSPMKWYEIIGKRAHKNYRIDEMINYED